MFYSAYRAKRIMMDNVAKKLEQKRKLQTKPVTIKNLVVYPDDSDTYGESAETFNISSDINIVQRLTDQVESLAQIANLHHQQAYCEQTTDGKHQLKKEHSDTITRLSLSEFSLYGKTPITLDEFTQLLTSVRAIAEKTQDNVHLLLSSFSVINEKNKILNISLYVQGGEEPKIDVITKGLASRIDVTYPEATRFSQQRLSEPTEKVSAFIIDDEGIESTISSNSIIEITTNGGAKFLQAVDVCLDHANKHSKKLLDSQVNLDAINSSDFLCEQVDQIVTSSSIKLEDNSKISTSVLHVDPRPNLAFDEQSKDRPIDTSIPLSSEAINSVKQYSETKIVSKPGKITVTKPPFGPDYHIKIYQEQQVGRFNPEIDTCIKTINDGIIERQVKRLLNEPSSQNLKEIESIDQIGTNTYTLANNLLQQLKEQCKPKWFEKLFKTTNYFLKLSIEAIIAKSELSLKEIKDDPRHLFLAHISPWARNMKLELNSLSLLPNSFLKELDVAVNTFQKTVEEDRPKDIPTFN